MIENIVLDKTPKIKINTNVISFEIGVGEIIERLDKYFATNYTFEKSEKSENYIRKYFLKDTLKKLKTALTQEKEHFEKEKIEMPNETVINETFQLINDLADNYIFPDKIALSVEEGICLSFFKDDKILYFELYNDGELGYIIENKIEKKILANEDINSLNDGRKIIEYYYDEKHISRDENNYLANSDENITLDKRETYVSFAHDNFVEFEY